MRLLALLLAGCAQVPPVEAPLGQASRPYQTLPEYLQNPIAEHELTAQERVSHMEELLRDIDARAGELDGSPGQAEELKLKVHELTEVVPPEDTRRRLWALTDLIRLRSQF